MWETLTYSAPKRGDVLVNPGLPAWKRRMDLISIEFEKAQELGQIVL
jgi:hypothetical protein